MKENQNILMSEIKETRFSEYYIFFTNSINNFFIEKLAELDEFDVIKQLQETYLDYYIVQ